LRKFSPLCLEALISAASSMVARCAKQAVCFRFLALSPDFSLSSDRKWNRGLRAAANNPEALFELHGIKKQRGHLLTAPHCKNLIKTGLGGFN
jgi:hypothetical protein